MRVLLVDDEPAALRHLQGVVEFTGVPCEIVGTAENGAQALNMIGELVPDIVITDMKMPVMDGIAFAFAIKEKYPDILTAVVSGYQDFEYLKGAIQSGVADYLLKPVGIEPMRNLMTSFIEKVSILHNTKRQSILNALRFGENIAENDLQKYFLCGEIYVAILRRNGIVSRLSTHKQSSGSFKPLVFDGYINLTGRDENEVLLVSITQSVSVSPESEVNEYLTIARFDNAFRVKDFKKICDLLYSALESEIVVGKNADISISLDYIPQLYSNISFDKLAKWEHYMASSQYEKLKYEFIDVFLQWEDEECPAIWVESMLSKLLNTALKYSIPQNSENVFYAMEDAVLNSLSIGELMSDIWALLARLLQIPEMKPQKIDTPYFFEEIKKYLENNISNPVSLQTLCGAFGISQTYASRLFRKYADTTFTDFLTRLRVEKAKEYLSVEPKIPIKDIAQMVGFQDQFYFSKVFRSVTGVPPSEYEC